MGLVKYQTDIDFETLVSFVLRTAMVDGRYSFNRIDSKGNKSLKLLGIIWIFVCFNLIQSYDGNLTAMLTRPTLKKSINSIQDLINQPDLKWSLMESENGNDLVEYLKTSETLRPLYDLAEASKVWEPHMYQCFSQEEVDAGTYVSICDYQNIQFDKSADFSATGKCNFYTTEETFFTTPQVMAFQVGEK